MKKLIFSLSLFLSFSTLVHAQWTTNGTVTTTTNAVGIGTTLPQSILHISGTGTFINQSTQVDPRSVIIQSSNGGRGLATGAQLEFVIPANTDGTNPWGQARIITVAGNSNNGDATGKMVLGTRRMINKLGTGANWYYGDDVTIDGGGNVGIGNVNPDAKLTVFSSTVLGGSPKNSVLLSSIGGDAGSNNFKNNIWIVRNASGNDWYSARLHDGISVDASFTSPQTNTLTWWERDPRLDIQSWGTSGNTYMSIVQGNVAIGTLDPKGYKLAVNGSAIATSMTVKLNSAWPDYVFKKDYQLPSLQEVKAYIDQNQHLPEIPSEQQIAKEGLNLGEMNKLLMKKMEEMTLYMIEAKEEINELKKQVQDLKKQNK